MKKHLRLLSLPLFVLVGCSKEFTPYLEKARVSFAEKNYIDTIDSLNAGVPNWKKEDGVEKKAEAFQLLGKSYHQLRNTDKAIEAFEQAVKLSNKTYDSAYTLGILHLTKSQPDIARKFFLEALKMKPNDPLALLGMGNSLYAEKKNADAVGAFEAVLDNSPGVREAMESLALLKSSRIKAPSKTSANKRTPAKKTTQRKKRS